MVIAKSDIARTAELHDLSFRTLRYYEERGLLNPIRRGVTRIYTSEDHLRIKIIQTGKRLGFSLAQIHDLIEPRAPAPSRGEKKLAEQGSILGFLTCDEIQQQLQLLERQRNDVNDTIIELRKSLDDEQDKSHNRNRL